MTVRIQLLVPLFAVATLAACGAPGGPRPPSLLLPRPVADLAATRKGDDVLLTWTAPQQTTDMENLRLRQLGPTRVCRGLSDFPMAKCDEGVGELPPTAPSVPPQQPERVTFTTPMPGQWIGTQPLGFATYAIAVLNARGRSAGLSNQIQVSLAPTVPAPANVTGAVTREGVTLSFSVETTGGTPGLQYGVRVFRSEQGSNAAPVPIGPDALLPAIGGAMQFQDRSFEWEKTYVYRLAVVTAAFRDGKQIAEVEGKDSEPVTIFARDVFPPAVPVGLEAVYSGVGQKPFVDLTWTPNTDADLAGYNVYRREQGGAPLKINRDLATTPAFRDAQVQPGHVYSYAVSAVDLRGNESSRSEETSETVP